MRPPIDMSEFQRIYQRREDSDFCSTGIFLKGLSIKKEKMKRRFLTNTTLNFYIFSEILTSIF